MEKNKSTSKSNTTTKEEKQLFSFGDYSKYHTFLFLVPLFHMMCEYVQKYIIAKNENKNNDKSKKDDLFKEYEFVYMTIFFISKLFSGFLYIISNYLINNEKINYELLKTKSFRIYHLNVNANNKCKIFLYLIIISFLEVIFKIENIISLTKKDLIENKLGFTIFVPILSYIFLKAKYHRHHLVSTIIGLFGFIFIILSLFYSKEKFVLGFQLIHFFISFPFSLSIIVIKYLFMHYFIGPFAFLFLDGILCIAFTFIYIIIKFLIIFHDFDLFIKNLSHLYIIFENIKIFLLFILVIILTFAYHAAKAVSLYFFTPALFVMTDILSPVFSWIIYYIYKKIKGEDDSDPRYPIFKSIGYIFLIIAYILFNEVIICHFWNLDYYTTKKIEERGIEDVSQKTNDIGAINDSILSDA